MKWQRRPYLKTGEEETVVFGGVPPRTDLEQELA
jgi:hypothetical protein